MPYSYRIVFGLQTDRWTNKQKDGQFLQKNMCLSIPLERHNWFNQKYKTFYQILTRGSLFDGGHFSTRGVTILQVGWVIILRPRVNFRRRIMTYRSLFDVEFWPMGHFSMGVTFRRYTGYQQWQRFYNVIPNTAMLLECIRFRCCNCNFHHNCT